MLRKLFTAALIGMAFGLFAANAQAGGPALEIGYLPILPDAQLFIALEEGTLQAQGAATPKLVSFQSGPALTQALIAGQLDVAYVGIGPALVARAKGAAIKVVASNIVEQVNVVALGPLASYFATGNPATAFARFTKDHGRKPIVASYPRGAVPEAALQYWLRNTLKSNEKDVQLIYQGEAQLQQSLLSGAIDGAAILEPAVSIVLARASDARVIAHGSQLFPNQPGAVLVVRQKLIDEHPEVVQQLVTAQIAATTMLRNEPLKAASAVQKYVGGGRLDRGIVERAIHNSHDQFVADPHAIIKATAELQTFQAKIGSVDAPAVDVAQLFDTRFYDHAVKP
jgi:NitT/TauT family transport system substrate-binding protein